MNCVRHSLKRDGPPDGGLGSLAPARGLVQPGCTPHFSFVVPKEKRAVHGPKRKALGALRCSGPPRARGSADRCLLRFCLAVGHAILFCEVGTAVPWRMVRLGSGCKDAFDQLLFYCLALRRSQYFRHQCSTGSSFRAFRFAMRCPGECRSCCVSSMLQLSSTTGQRQRKEKLDVSQTSPGQRSPQGPGVSVPDCRKGSPAFPRRRQEVCAGADRPAEHFFFSTGRGAEGELPRRGKRSPSGGFSF